jgi:MscS family membrane protein
MLLAITGIVWMLLLLTAYGERWLRRRFKDGGELTPLLRLVRRMADVIVISAGGLVTLYYFGFDPTAALAGLGIGGIAVALAAQKTLENVIGGLSIIFDKAVRVGDFLKLGDTLGTVDCIGLRSTRIRTLDRTILSVPNGQIANVNIETLSARDKFWFHHFVALRYETASETVRAIVDGIRSFLLGHPATDSTEAVRVRFFRLGSFSLDIEVFAYIQADDWDRFLEIQQEWLLGIMAIVERAGASIALPSQTLHVSDGSYQPPVTAAIPAARVTRLNVRGETAGPGT